MILESQLILVCQAGQQYCWSQHDLTPPLPPSQPSTFSLLLSLHPSILALLALTLATIAYILREFSVKLLEHTLHTRDHPDKTNRDSGW